MTNRPAADPGREPDDASRRTAPHPAWTRLLLIAPVAAIAFALFSPLPAVPAVALAIVGAALGVLCNIADRLGWTPARTALVVLVGSAVLAAATAIGILLVSG